MTRLFSRPYLIISVAIAVLLALVAGGATAVAAMSDIARGTEVLGIDIGGRTRADAAEVLVAGLGARLSEPVSIQVAGATTTVEPAAIGLALDVPATVAAATRGGHDPIRTLVGGDRKVEPVVTVDTDKLAEALDGFTKKGSLPKITFAGLTPKPTYPVAGQGIDPERAAEAVRAGWPHSSTIAVPLTDLAPRTSRAEVDRLVSSLAKPAVAAPVTVKTGNGTFTVTPKAIAASLVLNADATGTITPRIDQAKLRTAIATQLATVEVQPRAAEVPGANGSTRVLASTGGSLVDTAKLSRDLLSVLARPAPREISAELTTVAAKTATADLAKQGIVERVSSFTTYFNGGQDRNKNIILVAKEVDGAIVQPGETFSLNGYTGPRGYAEGYVDAPVISDGKLVNAVGGGISQFTTTLFNAAYYAGLEDVFHKPHSYYISRYPSVIESTIIYPDLDMRFRNDSATPVLIDTSATNRSITVTMWSTKRYDVSTEWGPRRDVVQPVTRHLPKVDGCIETVGSKGFAQDAWRIFRRNGQEVRREKFSWTYAAEPKFVCG